jgi:2'-5' RNA ligase
VTFGVWDRIDRPEADDALAALTAARAPFAVRFDAFDAFSGPEPGVVLTPTLTTRLRDLHEAVHASLAAHAYEPTSRRLPEARNPHCTLDTPAEVELACFPLRAR